MEEYIIIKLLNDFKSLIKKLNLIEIDDPLNYLREIVNQIMNRNDRSFIFEDNRQMYLFLKRINNIKNFFKEQRNQMLKSMNLYLLKLIIPNIVEHKDISIMKRKIEEQLNLLDINEIILSNNDFQALLKLFADFKKDYSKYYINKHEEINILRKNFGEDLLTSSEFKILSKLVNIEQISSGILNSPSTIRANVQEIRNLKCPISNLELVDILDKRPECSNCNKNFEEFFNPNSNLALLADQHRIIKNQIEESLLISLELIYDRKSRINEILREEKYSIMENVIKSFNLIFEYFNIIAEDRIPTAELFNKLSDLYSDEILEVIKRAFKRDPVTVIIDILEDIFSNITPNIYTEEELNIELKKIFETVKETKKQQKIHELELNLDDELPILRYRFKKREREDLSV